MSNISSTTSLTVTTGATTGAANSFKFQPAQDGFETLIGGLLEEAQKRLATLQTQRTAINEQIARIQASVKPIHEALAFYRRRKEPPATRATRPASSTARLTALALETARRDGEVSTRGLAEQAVSAGLFPNVEQARQFGSKVLSVLGLAGKLQRIGKGRYALPSATPATPAETG